jgi:soluble lytic murein transglycosylase-like protein
MAKRSRLVLAGAAAVLVVAVVVAVSGGGGEQRLALPGSHRLTWVGDPLAYVPSHAHEYVARATAGNANVLFVKSPGGVVATAARVAAFRPLIDAAVRGTGIDPNLLEGLVFLESAGNPNALAGPDVADAAGLTQILAQTGQSLLGMHIELAKSRRLTAAIDAAYSAGRAQLVGRLQRARAQIDARFDPGRALAATVRYIELARRDLGGRIDLAIESYNMGIGNLQHVLSGYSGGKPVPYVQLYFDTAPDHNSQAYAVLSGFGDDSSLYWWRVLGSVQIMQLYRTDRPALVRLAALETRAGSTAAVLGAADTAGPLVALPSEPHTYGLAYRRGLSGALRPAALDVLAVLGVEVKRYWSATAPLTLASAHGYSFSIERHYASLKQAEAFQAALDRLQDLNLIAWSRTSATIDVTASPEASSYLIHGP